MTASARIEELRKKFEENPRRYFAPLANEYRKAGDIEQAIGICREYLPQQPGHMSGHIVYGQALYEARQFDESKTVFETALTLDPENLIALRHLGDIALIVGDNDAARSWYKRVLEADPRNEEIQAQLAQIEQGGAAPAPTPSSAPTVVQEAIKVPPKPESPPVSDFAPKPPTTATSPTSEIRLDQVKAELPVQPPVQLPAEPLVQPTPGPAAAAAPVAPEPQAPAPLELDSAVPGTVGGGAPAVASFSLDGLETTSLASAAPSDSPPASLSTASTIELDKPVSNALPTPPPATPAPSVADIELAPAAELPAAAQSEQVPELLDLTASNASPPPALPPVDAPVAAPADASPVTSAAPPSSDLPLLDLGTTDATPPEPAPAPAPESGPFVTETMAELYLAQGHRDEALKVYKALLEQRPGDAALQAKIDGLLAPQVPAATTPVIPTPAPAPAPAKTTPPPTFVQPPRAPTPTGPTIREVLGLVALRKPGYRPGAQQNGSTPPEAAPPRAIPPEAPVAAPTPPSAAGPDVLSSLFKGSNVSDADESAARTLALAFAPNGFQPTQDLASIVGAPARVAANELSLDRVFSPAETPATPSTFSFDQFFSKNAAGSAPGPVSAGAPESPEDVAKFTQWLHGLKQR
ncbi:MAG TPA: tetratricopeptide repeat protein [Gemmatimonadaceae bacterium]|nr:tetratricopeptide repeat protein [Gemmatimonadaceae bacterium]